MTIKGRCKIIKTYADVVEKYNNPLYIECILRVKEII